MMVTTIENQSVVSHEWIARMERGGQNIIFISDNGMPLFYEVLVQTDERQEVLSRASGRLEEIIRESANSPPYIHPFEVPSSVTRYENFTLERRGRTQYFVSAVLIPRSTSVLEVFIIYSLESLGRQILNQRILLMILNLVGIGLLAIFSYFFTKKMLEPLKKSQKQQTEFIASASHELRTPVAVIQSSLSALKQTSGEESTSFYNSIESECVRMSRLINDLLTLARTDNSTFSSQMKEVELDTLLLDVVEKFDLLAREKEIHLSIDLPDKKTPNIRGDSHRLTQVFAILLDNAISYSPIESEVKLIMEVTKSRIVVQVIDNGPGISDEDKERIWERFYRVDASRKSDKHFGLGLPIAKEIVNLHKGKISVKDNPDGGTIFIVTLTIGG